MTPLPAPPPQPPLTPPAPQRQLLSPGAAVSPQAVAPAGPLAASPPPVPPLSGLDLKAHMRSLLEGAVCAGQLSHIVGMAKTCAQEKAMTSPLPSASVSIETPVLSPVPPPNRQAHSSPRRVIVTGGQLSPESSSASTRSSLAEMFAANQASRAVSSRRRQHDRMAMAGTSEMDATGSTRAPSSPSGTESTYTKRSLVGDFDHQDMKHVAAAGTTYSKLEPRYFSGADAASNAASLCDAPCRAHKAIWQAKALSARCHQASAAPVSENGRSLSQRPASDRCQGSVLTEQSFLSDDMLAAARASRNARMMRREQDRRTLATNM